jgi:uncharacterized protein YkwD
MTVKKTSNGYKDWLLNISIVACIFSMGIFLYLLIGVSRTGEDVQASSYNAEQVITAINKERTKQGLNPLYTNEKLTLAAENKAKDMKERNYFSHIYQGDNTKWSDFIKNANYDYLIAGENLANGFYSVELMVKAWMDSPTHRENILNPKFEDTGVGISFGELNGNPTIFVVQTFGKLEEVKKEEKTEVSN